MTELDEIDAGDGLEEETFVVRVLGAVDFSATALLLVVISATVGFGGLDGGLFLIDILEFVLSAVALYATLRLGPLLLAAIVLALLTLVANVGQWLARVILLPFTLLELVFLLIVTGFIIIDILFLVFLWQLYRADTINQSEEVGISVRELVLSQESNRIRMTAIFGLVGVGLLLVSVALLLGFTGTAARLCLFSIGHIPVAIIAGLFAAHAPWTMVAVMVLGFILLILDLIELVFRVREINMAFLSVLTVESIAAVVLIFINAALLLVGAMYTVTAFSYIYEAAFIVDTPAVVNSVNVESLKPELETSQASLSALRRRKVAEHQE